MLGTLNGALEVRGVSLAPEDISADVEGVNEVVEGLPVLTRVIVRYRLRICLLYTSDAADDRPRV